MGLTPPPWPVKHFQRGPFARKGAASRRPRTQKSERPRQATVSCIGAEGARGMKEEGTARKMTNSSNSAQRLTHLLRWKSQAKSESQCAGSGSGLGMQPESMHPSKEGFLSEEGEEGRRTVAADRRKFIIRPSSLDPSDCCSSSSVPQFSNLGYHT